MRRLFPLFIFTAILLFPLQIWAQSRQKEIVDSLRRSGIDTLLIFHCYEPHSRTCSGCARTYVIWVNGGKEKMLRIDGTHLIGPISSPVQSNWRFLSHQWNKISQELLPDRKRFQLSNLADHSISESIEVYLTGRHFSQSYEPYYLAQDRFQTFGLLQISRSDLRYKRVVAKAIWRLRKKINALTEKQMSSGLLPVLSY